MRNVKVRDMQRLLLGITALLLATASSADTKLNDGTVLSDSPAWIVTYIEVDAHATDEAAALISAQLAASRKEKGKLYFEGLQRIGQDNHFVVLEAWSDPEARAEHAAADHTQSFRKALQPLLYAPYDERPHVGLQAIAPQDIPEADEATVFVLTHADIIPPYFCTRTDIRCVARRIAIGNAGRSE